MIYVRQLRYLGHIPYLVHLRAGVVCVSKAGGFAFRRAAQWTQPVRKGSVTPTGNVHPAAEEQGSD